MSNGPTLFQALPHLDRACELLWQAGHPRIAAALEKEAAELLRALKEEMAWDMGGRSAEKAPWRVDRKVRRTIYAQFGDEASDADPLIGVMDTAVLALAAVKAHNEAISATTEAA